MSYPTWLETFPGAITVCDAASIILYMNAKSAKTYAANGGKALLGSNLLDCHTESSRAKLEKLIAARQKNVYTIEKNGVKKLIFQTPWFEDEQYAGFIEVSLEIPFEMPHFLRH
jgi:transcriptional regulator with PAS, ATPase and Fis domain